jgi:glucose 1-dehydrogenase
MMSGTALITGGSRGIGRGIVLALAQAGYDLAFCHWQDHERAAETAAAVREKHGRQCCVVHCNLEEEHEVRRLADEAVRALGRIDVLVNNAGITIFKDLTDTDPGSMDRLYRLNYRAPLLLMQAVGKHMIASGVRGSMINITSTRAERAYPGDAVYGGLKAALSRSIQSIALEYAAYGIRVNGIAPGAISTTPEREAYFRQLGAKIPLGRAGTPADIGAAAVWLASPESAYVTGTILRVDGGLILPGMPESVGSPGDIGWGRIFER